MMSPTGIRGSSELYGSWKMICMSRRSCLSWLPLAADGHGVRTARRKAAAGLKSQEVGHGAGNHVQPQRPIAAEHGNAGEQPLSVGMLWLFEESDDVGLLDDLAGVHHRDLFR